MGIPVIPCTDDVTMIRTNITEEYAKITVCSFTSLLLLFLLFLLIKNIIFLFLNI